MARRCPLFHSHGTGTSAPPYGRVKIGAVCMTMRCSREMCCGIGCLDGLARGEVRGLRQTPFLPSKKAANGAVGTVVEKTSRRVLFFPPTPQSPPSLSYGVLFARRRRKWLSVEGVLLAFRVFSLAPPVVSRLSDTAICSGRGPTEPGLCDHGVVPLLAGADSTYKHHAAAGGYDSHGEQKGGTPHNTKFKLEYSQWLAGPVAFFFEAFCCRVSVTVPA